MGYVRHNAIVVTGWNDEGIADAHKLATEIFAGTCCEVTAITPSAMNGQQSFLIAPDGSKRGWEASEQADEARYKFFDAVADRDALRWVEAVEVQFGGDSRSASVTRVNFYTEE